MYMIIYLFLSLIFSSFTYLLTYFQSIFLLVTSGIVLIYILTIWSEKNKLKLNTSAFLLASLVVAVSQIFLEVNLLFIYYNIWTMVSSLIIISLYKILYKEKKEKNHIEEVEVEIINSSSPPRFNGSSSHIIKEGFIQETEHFVWDNIKRIEEYKSEYKHIENELNHILKLDLSKETMSDMLYKLRNDVMRKDKEINNLLHNLEEAFITINNFKDEKKKLLEDVESIKEDEQFYINEATHSEKKYIEEKTKVEYALSNAKSSKEEAMKYKNKNTELKNLIDKNNQANIEKISNKRTELRNRWNILFSSFNFRNRIYKDVSKFSNVDLFYIELALHKLAFADDPKSLSRGIYGGTKGDKSYEHLGVEQTDVPYRIVYRIINKGKIRIEIDDIFKHSEKKFA